MSILAASQDLNRAGEELRFLLDRGYPREGSLVMVGNRHALEARERALLARAILAPEVAERRRSKLNGPADLAGRRLGIDGHNVLITLESALSGRDLIRGDDGVIRDIAGAASSYRPTDLTDRALDLILQSLADWGINEARFYLDSPISRSGELAQGIREILAGSGLAGTALAVPVPDRELKAYSGLVASSDGELIDCCDRPMDLAGQIITANIMEARVIELST